MELTLTSRLRKAWNAFTKNRDPTTVNIQYQNVGMGYTHRPDRVRFSRGNERSIVTSVYNRIAMDVAGNDIKHCRLPSTIWSYQPKDFSLVNRKRDIC